MSRNIGNSRDHRGRGSYCWSPGHEHSLRLTPSLLCTGKQASCPPENLVERPAHTKRRTTENYPFKMSTAPEDGLRQRHPQSVTTAEADPSGKVAKKDVFGSQGPQSWKRRHQGLLQDKLGRTGAGPLVPSFSVAVRMLLLIRSAGAMYSLISDCDEVFNFLEPLHYFRHNSGFQTWELLPEYAIRSWAYVLLHWPLAHLAPMILRVGKRQQFFALRLSLGLVSSLCEAKFYRAVVEAVNEHVGRYTLFAMAFSAGMWSASVAFLPSSFTMYTTLLACSYSFHPATSDSIGISRIRKATFFVALGAIVGWPFSAAIGIPLVFEYLFLTGGDVAVGGARSTLTAKRWQSMISAVVISLSIVPAVYLIDSWAYGRQTFPTLNIVLYNIFSSNGPDLYGISPWWYYLANLFLNFNYLLPFALVSLPGLLVTYFVDNRRLGKSQMSPKAGETSPYTLLATRLAPFYLWLVIMSLQPHKEERFMFPLYPLLCFNAAVGIYLIKGWAEVAYIKVTKSPYQASKSTWFSNFSLFCIVIPSLLSISRVLALHHFYHGPFEIVRHFQYSTIPGILSSLGYSPIPLRYKPKPREKITPDWDYSPLAKMDDPITLCYGTEWYRYPSSYFIPEGVNVQWVRTDFDGMMPRKWEASAISSSVWPRSETRVSRPGRFNGENKASAEPGTYVQPQQCDYIVASHMPSTRHTTLEPDWAASPEWQKEFCTPFLDAEGSQWWARLYWVPGDLLEAGRQWGEYCLLRNVDRAKKRA
ncbi:putative mannosyltransferase [Kockovaella imperatae]|uniref:Mannosyltransferase n=1 Tax=Kockovaella imperatae TaxID=4999 RepID=A0A1Y1UMM1_9TREE|nr:putative mannosyltransferase [Kockovaella imperatae]ORX39298.1 putative mannosyltransferase [Kockovaella imperatae]